MDTTRVHYLAEEMPEYPGGEDALTQYLWKIIPSVTGDVCNPPTGPVRLNFTIERDGSVCDVEVKNAVSEPWGRKVAYSLEAMPHWKPGSNRGVPVNVRYSLPLRICLR
ncbi:MAG: energy transducer TonB [Flavobacteriales bacterium]|nr:energy transducer TonB [Flavobacteriales bacterium]